MLVAALVILAAASGAGPKPIEIVVIEGGARDYSLEFDVARLSCSGGDQSAVMLSPNSRTLHIRGIEVGAIECVATGASRSARVSIRIVDPCLGTPILSEESIRRAFPWARTTRVRDAEVVVSGIPPSAAEERGLERFVGCANPRGTRYSLVLAPRGGEAVPNSPPGAAKVWLKVAGEEGGKGGASVHAYSSANGAEISSSSTDEFGWARVALSGTSDVLVLASQGRSAGGMVFHRVASSWVTGTNYLVMTESIFRAVVSRHGRPVAGADVTISLEHPAAPLDPTNAVFELANLAKVSARTNGEGRFETKAPVPGTYRITVRAPDLAPVTIENVSTEGADGAEVRLEDGFFVPTVIEMEMR